MNTYVTTKQQLMAAQVPQETRTYKPITHGELIDLTMNSIVGAGFKLDSESYTSAADHNIATGRFTLSNVKDSEMQIVIAWQNSYNKMISLKFAIGAHVFICSNGCVHGDMGAFKKKHTGSVQEFAPKTITEYIKSAGDVFQQMQKERDEMKKIELDIRTKAQLVGRMFLEEEFLTTTQLNVIKREIAVPSYDYKAENSLWELYNHTTHSLKELHPTLWMKNHIEAHKFFVKEANIIVNTPTQNKVDYHISPNQLDMFESVI